jgi:uncharacterized membrane protein (UPF0127 family)
MRTLIYNNKAIIPELIVADTFWKRSVGLLGRAQLKASQGLLLRPCDSIHTCFMRFTIDVIFLDTHNQVVQVKQNVAPWRLVWGGRKAHSVIEVQSGWLIPLPRVGDFVDDINTDQ